MKSIFDNPQDGGPSKKQIECLIRMRRKSRIQAIEGLVLIIATIVVLGVLVRGYVKCTAHGGDYVRTLFWYTCTDNK